MAMILLDRAASGHCWKVRLLLSHLGLAYRRREIDTLAGEARTEEFLRINPRAQVPVLLDGAETIADSQAILVYLARGHAPDLLPLDPLGMAEVMRWLAVAGQDMQSGVRAARAVLAFNLPGDLATAQAVAERTLAMIDRHLADRGSWLASGRLTIADFAIYPYVSLAPEAGLPLERFPNLHAWCRRVEAMPGYVALAD